MKGLTQNEAVIKSERDGLNVLTPPRETLGM